MQISIVISPSTARQRPPPWIIGVKLGETLLQEPPLHGPLSLTSAGRSSSTRRGAVRALGQNSYYQHFCGNHPTTS